MKKSKYHIFTLYEDNVRADLLSMASYVVSYVDKNTEATDTLAKMYKRLGGVDRQHAITILIIESILNISYTGASELIDVHGSTYELIDVLDEYLTVFLSRLDDTDVFDDEDYLKKVKTMVRDAELAFAPIFNKGKEEWFEDILEGANYIIVGQDYGLTLLYNKE